MSDEDHLLKNAITLIHIGFEDYFSSLKDAIRLLYL